MVSVAQLVRALDCGSRGWGFETPRSPLLSSSFSMDVQRRDNLRTDRRIVLRTRAYTFPWIKFRSWLIRSLRDSFFGGKVHLLFMKNKPGILVVVEMRQRSSIEVLKRFLMWHPPLLKSTNKIRGGMDATIEAFA